MTGIKFTLYYSVWVGSDYSKWTEVEDYFKFSDRIKVSKLKDIMSGRSYTRFQTCYLCTTDRLHELNSL